MTSTVAAGGHSGPGDDQRHVDVGVERRLLAGQQAVLAHVVTVVGAEDEVGVAGDALVPQGLLQVRDQVVDREIGPHPLPVGQVDGCVVPPASAAAGSAATTAGRSATCRRPGCADT